jgi:hypothetical protein
MVGGVIFAVGGWIAIFEAHNGKSHFAAGQPWAKVVHVYLGYLILLAALVQAVSGAVKISSKTRVAVWHGAILGASCAQAH